MQDKPKHSSAPSSSEHVGSSHKSSSSHTKKSFARTVSIAAIGKDKTAEFENDKSHKPARNLLNALAQAQITETSLPEIAKKLAAAHPGKSTIEVLKELKKLKAKAIKNQANSGLFSTDVWGKFLSTISDVISTTHQQGSDEYVQIVHKGDDILYTVSYFNPGLQKLMHMLSSTVNASVGARTIIGPLGGLAAAGCVATLLFASELGIVSNNRFAQFAKLPKLPHQALSITATAFAVCMKMLMEDEPEITNALVIGAIPLLVEPLARLYHSTVKYLEHNCQSASQAA